MAGSKRKAGENLGTCKVPCLSVWDREGLGRREPEQSESSICVKFMCGASSHTDGKGS